MANFSRILLSIYFAFLLILFPVTLYKIFQDHTIPGAINEILEGSIIAHFLWVAPAIIAAILVNTVEYQNYKKVFFVSLLVQAVLFYLFL